MSWCTSSSQCCLRDPDPSPVLMVTMEQGQGTSRRGSCLVWGKGSVMAGAAPHQHCQSLLLADHGSSLQGTQATRY